jgi:hypothetical protein
LLERGTTLAVALSVFLVGCGSGEHGQSQPIAQSSVEFVANPATVSTGANAWLSWTGHNATSCQASGGWSGEQPATGGFRTAPLTATTTYTLSCTGPRYGSIAHVTVRVDSGKGGASAEGPPQVSLRSQQGSIPASGSTVLEWNARGAHTCTASGGWSGAKPSSGSQRISGLKTDATYTLTCDGPEGTGIAMAEVMLQRATLRWSNSSTASNHTAFRVLWGKRADQPENQVTITNPKLRERVIDLPGSGTYYFILATLDGTNKEIGRSNTASKLLPP